MEITSIIQHVFKQPSLEGVSLSELERFTAKQPFFAVGQYLLLKKMQDIRDPGFEKQLQKTRLYFENPLWLQQLLLKKHDSPGTQLEEPLPAAIETEQIENEWANNNEIIAEQQALSDRAVQLEDEEVPEVSAAINGRGEMIVENNGFSASEVQETTGEGFAPSMDEVVIEASRSEEVQHINEVDLSENQADKDEPVVINETTGLEAELPVKEVIESTSSDNLEEIDNSGEEEGKPGFVLPIYTKHTDQTEDKIVFQAYHTVDYFASQGIKISNKADMSDKLGTQLKSFTDWLKTMKRLPPSKLEQQMEEKESEVVIEMASHSLESKEVLTETMAEVLLKQGKKESAIEVYNKLSLLNPSKTPYFAAKIEAIKRN